MRYKITVEEMRDCFKDDCVIVRTCCGEFEKVYKSIDSMLENEKITDLSLFVSDKKYDYNKTYDRFYIEHGEYLEFLIVKMK